MLIIAELSANHAGSLQVAKDSIRAMAECGADAVKLQTYTPDSLTLNVKSPDFQLHGGLWDGQWLYDLYTQGATPYEWHKELFDYARSLGLIIFSTPFDREAVDLLESLDNPIYKIASFEVTDLDLISYAASKGKPMVISTGIATDREIHEAIEACHSVGNYDITLLKCTSAYPASIEEANLAMIPAMRERYDVKIGLSDHSPGTIVAEIATELGATMIEKHFILDRSLGGPDAEFSMTPAEFRLLVSRCHEILTGQNLIDRGAIEANGLIYKGSKEDKDKQIERELIRKKVMGSVDFDRAGQSDGRKWSRSLYVSKEIAEGETFTRENIRCVRPGYSLHPRHLEELIGRPAPHAYHPGDRLELEMRN